MSGSPVWIVTGTSMGIGLATTEAVLAAGERVVAVTRKASSMAKLVDKHSPEQLLVIEFDVGNPAHSAPALIEKVHAHFGRIDVLINSAGYGLNAIVESITDQQARAQLEVNFWGPVRLSREAVKYFREHNPPSQGGRILNISSVGGFNSNATLAIYSASKFALEGFSEGLHKEMDPKWNIKVITVQPGGVRTEWAGSSMIEVPFPPAYADPEGIPVRFRKLVRGSQLMNDTNKVARALIQIAKEANPPLRVPLGPDAQHLIKIKLDEIRKEVDAWDEFSVSVTADDADPHFFKKLDVVTEAGKSKV